MRPLPILSSTDLLDHDQTGIVLGRREAHHVFIDGCDDFVRWQVLDPPDGLLEVAGHKLIVTVGVFMKSVGLQEYWINEDLLRAMAEANAHSSSVQTAPVKRLLSIQLLASPTAAGGSSMSPSLGKIPMGRKFRVRLGSMSTRRSNSAE